jgi:hypothetical protein
MPPWPADGPLELIEHDAASGRVARFIVDRWCLIDATGPRPFDLETFRVLLPYVQGRKRTSAVVLRPLPRAA